MPEATTPTRPRPDKLLLTQPEAWAYLGLSRSAWFRLRALGDLPEPVGVPESQKMWRRADLDRWVGRLKPARRRNRKPAVAGEG